MDDPLLDLRRGARRQLCQAGILSAYDLQSARDRLVVDRQGVSHYVDAIDPERARRIEVWREAVSREASACLPAMLPPRLAGELDQAFVLAVRELRRRRHATVRRLLARARELEREAAQAAAAAAAEEEAARRALRSEEDRLTAALQAAQATLRDVRWQEERIAAERALCRDISFGRFLMDLLVVGRGGPTP